MLQTPCSVARCHGRNELITCVNQCYYTLPDSGSGCSSFGELPAPIRLKLRSRFASDLATTS
jgi:hypothetical protein